MKLSDFTEVDRILHQDRAESMIETWVTELSKEEKETLTALLIHCFNGESPYHSYSHREHYLLPSKGDLTKTPFGVEEPKLTANFTLLRDRIRKSTLSTDADLDDRYVHIDCIVLNGVLFELVHRWKVSQLIVGASKPLTGKRLKRLEVPLKPSGFQGVIGFKKANLTIHAGNTGHWIVYPNCQPRTAFQETFRDFKL